MEYLMVEPDYIRKKVQTMKSLIVEPDYIRKQGTNYEVPHCRA